MIVGSRVGLVQGVESVVVLLWFYVSSESSHYTMCDIIYHLYDMIEVMLEYKYVICIG